MSLRAQDLARCWAEVDLGALDRNVRAIAARLPAGVRHIGVVKADAYGHGLPRVAARLMESGVGHFAVANVVEGAALREAGHSGGILVLGPLVPGEEQVVAGWDLAVAVAAVPDVERLAAAGRDAGRPVAVHLKIDTGMGRSGVWHEDAPALHGLIAANPDVRLEGILTHFASADEDIEFTRAQRRLFLRALERCGALGTPDLLIHADNSAGLESLEAGGPFNAVRVGLLQYGISPLADPAKSRFRTEPVLSLHARVGLVKTLAAGTSVGYGRARVLARDSTVALLCAGYADGVDRGVGDRGHVLLKGRRCPILGRVSMDETSVDVTDVPGIAAGEEAVFIGRQGREEISAAEFARWAGTIPWEILCGISKRVPRIYV